MPDDELGLAPLFPLRDFEGPLSEYIERLWWMYRAMDGLRIFDRPVALYGEPTADGRDSGFWHLVTGDGRHGRQLDLARCANLPRVWDVLERLAAGDLRVLWWREQQALHVCPVDFSMVVILREDHRRLRLLTAYPLSSCSRRQRMMERAARSWLSGVARPARYRHTEWRRGSWETRGAVSLAEAYE